MANSREYWRKRFELLEDAQNRKTGTLGFLTGEKLSSHNRE